MSENLFIIATVEIIFTIVETISLFLFMAVIVLSILAIAKTSGYCKLKLHGKGVDRSKRSEPYVQSLWEQIGIEELNPSRKAEIFLHFMKNDEVLSHKFVNGGDKYGDGKQIKRFKRSLTNDVIQLINNIEGKDI